MSFSIEGKTAVVTGAANGIGLAIARHFADNGANVVFADMDEKRLKNELGDLPEDGNIRYFAGDLRERLTAANLLSATIDAFERVDVLVNASRQILPTDVLNADDDSLWTLLEQNLLTSFRISQMVAKRMLKQAEDDGDDQCSGSIINLSSIASHRAQSGLLGYSVSTAALDQLTRSLAVELANKNIRVNSVAFGSLMSASLQATLKDHPEYRAEIEKTTPLGWIASANELVEAAQYLASDASRFMTGQTLVLDGGRTLLDAVKAAAH
jgi:7-alpha-hydroxysteroid dehydrogenase